MSTRGHIAWKIKGETVYSYNHSDSYPSWLGEQVLAAARTIPDLPAKLSALRLLDEGEDASPDDIAEFGPRTGQNVSRNVDNYAIFRSLQGDLPAMIEAGVACTIDAPHDDEEWGYLLDFDADEFVVQEATWNGRSEWEVRARFPLADLPANLDGLEG
jgi:hypothetical protein